MVQGALGSDGITFALAANSPVRHHGTPKDSYIGWDSCPGDEKRLHKGRLGRVPAFTLFGCRIPSTVELATADIVCADLTKGRLTSDQV